MLAWLAAFVWTCALELPVYGIALRRLPGPWWRPLPLTLGLNAATHPLLWLALLHGHAQPLPAELAATAAEAVLLGARLRLGPRRAAAAAAAANALSAGAGLLFASLLG